MPNFSRGLLVASIVVVLAYAPGCANGGRETLRDTGTSRIDGGQGDGSVTDGDVEDGGGSGEDSAIPGTDAGPDQPDTGPMPDAAHYDAGPDCTDGDGDGYGAGTDCLGADCNDADTTIHVGATELCNGIDEDCDGTNDNGFAGLGAPCTAGVGQCIAPGTMSCASATGPVTCNAIAGTPGTESCNGLDDDCDSSTDEALGTTACGVGACASTAPACSGGSPGICTPGTPAATDACPANGLDEDCNGLADEDCPGNDLFANALTLPLGASESVVSGNTTGAARDGATVVCGCTSAGNVWYRFTVPSAGVVYLDTAGSAYDTSLFITDSAGTPVPAQASNNQPNAGLCNDDSGCGTTTTGFTSGLQSRTWGYFAAGTYYVSVGGCATGAFTLRSQFVPSTIGSYFYSTQLTGDTTTSTVLVGTSAQTGTCGGTASGEDVRWFVTCGAQQFFSLCSSDMGSFERREGTINYDPSLYIRSAQTGAEVSCNDDGGSMGGTTCTGTGTGADTAAYGSRLNNVTAPRGLNAVFVDERSGGSGMNYTLRYTVR